MIHICKMIISLGACFYFFKFSFFGLLRGEKGKNRPKCRKILSMALGIPGTIHHVIVINVTPV